MERRKFVIGLGALATGSAAAVGTGAFTRAEADRGISMSVANDDSDAAIKFETQGLYPHDFGPDNTRGLYAEVDGGNLKINLDNEGGMNVNADFLYRNVVQIQNQSDNIDFLLGWDVSEIESSSSIDSIDVFVSDHKEDHENTFTSITDTLNFSGPYGPEIADEKPGAVLENGENVYLHIYIQTTGENVYDLNFNPSFGAVDVNAYGTGAREEADEKE